MFDHKNFSKILKINKISSQKLSDSLKDIGIVLGKDSIDAYRKGLVQSPRYEVLEYVASVCNKNIIDFFEDRESVKKSITKLELKTNLDYYLKYLPKGNCLPTTLKKVAFNHGYPSTNNIVMENNMQNAEYIYIDKLILPAEYQTKELNAVIIIGDAMLPCLKHGDVAIYHPLTQYQAKGKYVINSADGLEVINIEKLKKCGSLVLKPSNPIFTTETLSPSEQDLIEIVGLVITTLSKS